MHSDVRIEEAGLADLEAVTDLFLGYLDFYQAPTERDAAKSFLSERMSRGESTVLLARVDGKAAGFTQIYPLFSSVRRAPVWLLNDLFVAPDFRRHGVGRALIQAVAERAEKAGVVRVELSTAETNTQAQALYEAEGFVADVVFRRYSRRIG
ncbi:GNAT family N-acetyltransferase [Actinoplanes regularis]|uniref:GNAT family N-acetyltransferase n=1 Tax=Actinoplanes regularis TaxID=52697 RepID=UPI00249FE4A2|nr:GNAT family N-acetyltransferase [Actinoplanes regularis]GLW31165.1 N-acetyltransferase [Actinoplanes regularis]